MKRLPVAEWAASELDVQREVMDLEDDANILAALACWDGRSFTLPDGADLWSIHRGLTFLANGCDEHAERHTNDPEVRRYHRWARDGLTGLASRVVRA